MKSKRVLILLALAALSGCTEDSVTATPNLDGFSGVYYGPIDRIIESHADWVWGDSVDWLCQQWSLRFPGQSGWFYGTGVPWSSVDVFVLDSSVDPLSVIAAENFAYTNEAVAANVGDTVFFRGTNGFFGAWKIDAIEGDLDVGATLSGTWYFKSGGGGDFTGELRPEITPMQQSSCTFQFI